MSNITTYLKNKLLDHCLATASFTMPTTLFAGLYVVTPTVDGGGTEVSASDYSRVVATFSPTASGSTTNSNAIRFPAIGTATSNWGTGVALGLSDSFVAGNLFWFGPLSANVVMDVGNDFLYAPGTLTISFA